MSTYYCDILFVDDALPTFYRLMLVRLPGFSCVFRMADCPMVSDLVHFNHNLEYCGVLNVLFGGPVGLVFLFLIAKQ